LKKLKEEQRLNTIKEMNAKTESITNKALDDIIATKELPSTALTFEVQFNSFKEKYEKLWLYIKKFASTKITELYSKREAESKIFIMFVRCFSTVYTSDNAIKISEYLLALSKTKSAKLMAKFLVKKEKAE